MRITTSNVRKGDSESPIITPVTGVSTAMTTRMSPWTGAVSNNKNNKGISTAAIYHTRWESRVSVCIEYGVTGRHAPQALHAVFTRECRSVPESS